MGCGRDQQFSVGVGKEFRPRVAALLNVTEDHLDRYASFADYCQAKERYSRRSKAPTWRSSTATIPWFGRCASDSGAHGVLWFWRSRRGLVQRTPTESSGAMASEEERFSLPGSRSKACITWRISWPPSRRPRCRCFAAERYSRRLKSSPVSNTVSNLCAKRRRSLLQRFQGHQCRRGGEVAGEFYRARHLIAGGVDKGGDYGPLADGIKSRVRRLVLFGAAKQIIASALGKLTTTVMVDDLAAAVRDAAAHAQPGDVVLLSPACSSFDQFRNYAERGKSFKNLVQAL